jgi:hypothetical protein
LNKTNFPNFTKKINKRQHVENILMGVYWRENFPIPIGIQCMEIYTIFSLRKMIPISLLGSGLGGFDLKIQTYFN